MTKKKKPKRWEKPGDLGRPRTNPEGARNRTIRLTDGEYRHVVAFLRGLRAQKPRES